MTRSAARTRRAEVGVALAVLLVLVLPLLLAALTLGMGGLPHDAGMQAARAQDASLAALDRADRFLHGDLKVSVAPALLVGTLDAPELPPEPPADAQGTVALSFARVTSVRVAAESERRL